MSFLFFDGMVQVPYQRLPVPWDLPGSSVLACMYYYTPTQLVFTSQWFGGIFQTPLQYL